MRSFRRSKSDTDFLASKLNIINTFLDENVSSLQPLKTVIRKDNNDNEMQKKDPPFWSNCDTSIWMRSCEEEVIKPIKGRVNGEVPKWLRGTLLRNGPGSLKVGEYKFNHLFDGSALLHKFNIADGDITYQRRFVQTDVYKKNHAAQRIVITEFGTKAVPDPCQSIFYRIAASFRPADNVSDNSMISIYPFGDEYYTFTEFPIIHRIDINTLETMNKVNVSDYVSIVNHTSHPIVMSDGSVYNVGMSISPRGPAYNVVYFSPTHVGADNVGNEEKLSMFDKAKIVATVPSRWILNPSYMHTFGITKNYYIIIEQPLSVNLVSSVSNNIFNNPLSSCLKWFENENTLIHVISKRTGQVYRTFVAEAFFYLHIINQFETHGGDYVVLDVCCYRDPKMLDCMYIDVMKDIHKNPEYAKLFRGRPLRFVMPLKKPMDEISINENLINMDSAHEDLNVIKNTVNEKKTQNIESCDSETTEKLSIKDVNENKRKEIMRIRNLQSKAKAHKLATGEVFVKPELLCDMGCETPRLNNNYVGKQYQYFYAISSDVDLDNPGTLIKVDTVSKMRRIWNERGVYPSEPIFVPNPNGKNEDDGVVLSAIIWGQDRETEVGLLILDADTFTEIARVTYVTPGPVPKCLHGWFSMNA